MLFKFLKNLTFICRIIENKNISFYICDKFLDYAVSDIFRKTYIEEESEPAATPTVNSEE
jgi:hypothetical protein